MVFVDVGIVLDIVGTVVVVVVGVVDVVCDVVDGCWCWPTRGDKLLVEDDESL